MKVNEDLFLQDYEMTKQEKQEVVAQAEVAVANIVASDAAKAKIKEILVEENSTEIDRKLSFYEKYVVEESEVVEENEVVAEETVPQY